MAKDVASPVSGDEALEGEICERAERAAAQIPSIHARWSVGSATEEDTGGAPAGTTAAPDTAPAPDAEAPAPDAASVSVTPILGIATTEDDDGAHRPRFKTLMGVPRTDPEIDDLAGLDPVAERPHDTVRLERATQRPVAASELSSQPALTTGGAAGRTSAREEPSLAATSWPWERNAPLPVSPSRGVAPQWSALVESSLDVSAEVAALRTARPRRTWLIGLAALLGALVLFSVAAPRERTLALRWLRREVQTRIDPAVDAVTDRARSLRPARSVVDPADESPSSSGHLATAASGAELERAPESAVSPGTESATPSASESSVSTTPGTAAALTAPATGKQGAPTGGSLGATTLTATSPDERSTAKNGAPSPASHRPHAAAGRSTDPRSAERQRTEQQTGVAPVASRDARLATVADDKARAQLAAPRKRQRSAAAPASTPKPRSTRQNSPRKDSGGGIIRETPF